jgi:hypothetical protein
MNLITPDKLIYTQYRNERLGRRDDYHYSERHNLYGRTSIINPDFMEIKGTKAVLVGDLKFSGISTIDLDGWQANVYRNNFTCPAIFLVYWYFDQDGKLIESHHIDATIAHAQYYPVAINKQAVRLLGSTARKMVEKEWVHMLHFIRGTKEFPTELNGQPFSTTWKEVDLNRITILGEPQ